MNSSLLTETNQTLTNEGGKGLFYEIYWTFLIPFICFFGTITNTISVVCLIKIPNNVQNGSMFKFMLSNSAINAVYEFLCGFIFLLRCGSLCNTNISHLELIIYNFVIWDYLTSSMAILVNFNEIIMCIQRYSVIVNWKRFQFKRFNIIFSVLIFLSLIVYLPRLFFRTINKKGSFNGEYQLVNTEFKSNTIGFLLDILVSVIRGPVCLIIIITINILTGIKFVKLIKKKKALKRGHPKSGKFLINKNF